MTRVSSHRQKVLDIFSYSSTRPHDHMGHPDFVYCLNHDHTSFFNV
jgi:hypothetical protein